MTQVGQDTLGARITLRWRARLRVIRWPRQRKIMAMSAPPVFQEVRSRT